MGTEEAPKADNDESNNNETVDEMNENTVVMP